MVNVDTVYKTVLYILNKEQRGYITPDEFNRLGTQVQLEIFEQYFEELNQQLRLPQTDSEYANRIKNLEEKIDVFKKYDDATYVGPHFTLPTDLHRLGTLIYNEKEIQGVNRNEYFLINKSPLVKPTESNPLYVLEGIGRPSAAPSLAYIYPDSIISGVEAYYIKAPRDPKWGYTVDTNNGAYIYDNSEEYALIAGWDMIGSITQNTTGATTGTSYTGVVGTDLNYTTSGYGEGAGITITVDSGSDVNAGTLGSSLLSSVTQNFSGATDTSYTNLIPGTTTGVLTSGSGTGLNLDLTVSGGVATALTINTLGTGFVAGDTITFTAGGGVFGSGPDMIITIGTGEVTSVVVDNTLIGTGFGVGDTITVDSSVFSGTSDLIITLRQSPISVSDLYTDTTAFSTDFELHPSEQTNIILNILMYSGVIIRDPQVVQTAARMVQQDEALEKQ